MLNCFYYGTRTHTFTEEEVARQLQQQKMEELQREREIAEAQKQQEQEAEAARRAATPIRSTCGVFFKCQLLKCIDVLAFFVH
jgi:uncharacterized membrane protein YqiK